MIFSIQRFLEDHFERLGLADVDQYAIRIANTFERIGPGASQETLAREIGRLRTVFYRRNSGLCRKDFEVKLVETLLSRFKKKRANVDSVFFNRCIAPARARLRVRRRSIVALLYEFKKAIEARAVDVFWDSRRKQIMRSNPEKIAQALLAVFAKGVLDISGMVLKEITSGIGFVDIGISFGKTLHLIELKILRKQFVGVKQLATYMRTESRSRGWLLLIDARTTQQKTKNAVPNRIEVQSGSIMTVLIDVNPIPPHRR
jgi:hypothetical protein